MGGKKKDTPGLLSQYADLRDDDEDEGSELRSHEGLEPSVTLSQPPPVDDAGALSDCDRMSEGSPLEGTWFPANKASGSKRLRDQESGSLTCLLEPSRKVKTPQYPTNKTVASQGLGVTILIAQEPDDLGESLGSSTKRLCLDPLGIARGLKTLLDFSVVKDVRINRHRNIVAVEFSSIESSEKSALLAARALGKYAIHCYRPALDSPNVSWGVIHHVALDEDLEELQAIISCDAFQVLRIIRLNRFSGGSKQPSTSVKVGFAGNSIPKFVQLDFLQVPVKPFVDPPLRCYRCQRPGHLASGCTAALRCLVCAGNHTKDDCSAERPHCANCGGDHVASSRSCRVVAEGLRIQELVRDGLTFTEARKKVRLASSLHSEGLSTNGGYVVRTPSAMPALRGRGSVEAAPQDITSSSSHYRSPTGGTTMSPIHQSASGSGLETVTIDAEVHQTQGSYIIPHRYPRQRPSYAASLFHPQPATQDLVQSGSPVPSVPSLPTLPSAPAPPPCVSQASCVSSMEDSITEKCIRHLDKSIESLFSRLSKFLLEVLSANLALENKRQRELLLIGMVRNHFGPSVGDTLLSSFHEEQDTSGALPEKPSTRSTSLPRKSKASSAPPPPSIKAGKGASKKVPPSSARTASSKK